MDSPSAEMSPQRLEAFSDGVLAIAITLLALTLTVPDSRTGDLWGDLTRQWPQFAAYLVGFLTIGILWVNHHAAFRHLARVDRPVLFINLYLLLIASLMPFTTHLMAEHLTSDNGNASVAMAVHSFARLLLNWGMIGLLAYTALHGDLLRGVRVDRPVALRRFAASTAVNGGTVVLSFISPEAALAAHFLIVFYISFDRLPLVSEAPTRAP